MIASFSNNGQQCLAGSRILIEKELAKEFKVKFVQRVKNLKVGDPFDLETEVGPLISSAQVEKVLSYAEHAKSSNETKILCGGKKPEPFDKGFYLSRQLLRQKIQNQSLSRGDFWTFCNNS